MRAVASGVGAPVLPKPPASYSGLLKIEAISEDAEVSELEAAATRSSATPNLIISLFCIISFYC